MKKYLFFIAIASAFLACNGNNPSIGKVTPDNVIKNFTQLADKTDDRVDAQLEQLGLELKTTSTEEGITHCFYQSKNRPDDSEMGNITEPVIDLGVTLSKDKFRYMEGEIYIPADEFSKFYIALSNKLYSYLKKEYAFQKSNPETNSEGQNHWGGNTSKANYSDIEEHYANLYLPEDKSTYDNKIADVGPDATNTRDKFVTAIEELSADDLNGVYESARGGRTGMQARKLFYTIQANGTYIGNKVYSIHFFYEETKKADAGVDVTEGWCW